MSLNNVIPGWLLMVKSPCPADCQGIEVTAFGPKKYRLSTGDCRAPGHKSCCLRIGRETNDTNND